MTLLVWLTIILAVVLVAVLAGYLLVTAIQLTQARRDIEKIADALERAADNGEPLGDAMEAIEAWTRRLADRAGRIAGRAGANPG